MKRCSIRILAIFVAAGQSFAQDLEKIGRGDLLKISGGLNLSSVYYQANGIPSRRQPFTYFVNGNITGSLLDLSLPVNFSYNNNQLSYSQNFNINSFNPRYKWIKGTFGNTSVNFSPYTLSSHLFTGGALELNPKWFRFGVMHGRLKKAVEYDHLSQNEQMMSFKRMGSAMYAGYEKDRHAFRINFFHAKDDLHSLSFLPVGTAISPMENSVISVSGRTELYNALSLDAEYALSMLTRNLSVPAEMIYSGKKVMYYFLHPNASTQLFSALRASGGYRFQGMSLQMNYDRIDPDFQTLGAYFFNNDMENITLAPSFNFWSGKLSLALNTGLQRNNLHDDKLNTTRRWIGSASAAFIPNKKFNMNVSYSNFSSYTRQKPQVDPFYRNTLDTLNFYQLTQNANASCNYSFGNDPVIQSLFFSLNYMVSVQRTGRLNDVDLFSMAGGEPVTTFNYNTGYTLKLPSAKASASAIINCNDIRIKDARTIYIGPGCNVSRPLFKELVSGNAGLTYNQIYLNGIRNGEALQARAGLSYSPKQADKSAGRISFSFNASYLQRLANTGFREFTGNVGLSYSF